MADIPLDLFQRIAERANDPMRRTYMAGANANAQPLDFGALMADLQKHGAVAGAQGSARRASARCSRCSAATCPASP